MKTDNKTFKSIYLFFIAFLFGLFLILAEDVQATTCNGVAALTCRLDKAVGSGSVTCSLNTLIGGTPCAGAVKSGTCTISAGETECSISSVDCVLSPFYVRITGSVNNNGASYSGCAGAGNYCTTSYHYPLYNSDTNYHWVCLTNPDGICTITVPYTGASSYCNDVCAAADNPYHNVHEFNDRNENCVVDKSSCSEHYYYEGGQCGICSLNNSCGLNCCQSKYPENTYTLEDCIIKGYMWTYSNKDFTIYNNVTFWDSNAILEIKNGNLILEDGGTITVPSGVTIYFHPGKEIKMQGGTILMTGGYILNQIKL